MRLIIMGLLLSLAVSAGAQQQFFYEFPEGTPDEVKAITAATCVNRMAAASTYIAMRRAEVTLQEALIAFNVSKKMHVFNTTQGNAPALPSGENEALYDLLTTVYAMPEEIVTNPDMMPSFIKTTAEICIQHYVPEVGDGVPVEEEQPGA